MIIIIYASVVDHSNMSSIDHKYLNFTTGILHSHQLNYLKYAHCLPKKMPVNNCAI